MEWRVSMAWNLGSIRMGTSIPGPGRGRTRRSTVDLALQVTLGTDLGNQALLRLQPVDVLLLVVQDAAEQLAADVVRDTLAVGDGGAQVLRGSQLQVEIRLQRLDRVFADVQLAQVLQVGQPIEEQDALDQV